MLQVGIEQAMSLNRAVVRQAASLLSRKAIRAIYKFRFTIISEGPDLSLFSQPESLAILSLFISEALQSFKMEAMPLVVAVLQTETFLVCGTVLQKRTYLLVFLLIYRKLGLAFNSCLNDLNVRARHDDFNSLIFEIDQGDLAVFLENLHLHL